MKPLASLSAARLGYSRRAWRTKPIDLRILPAASGGHALLGNNGHGKTLLSQALLHDNVSLLHGGSLEFCDGWTPRSAGHVSFDAHQQLLREGGTVYRALGHLSAAAKYLVVRFGLHPLLYRSVRTISTGEMRKVLLARALGTRPRLLVLDNAFDGLDAPSRASLAELVSMTITGFGQLLVQGVDASATAHTQVLLLTHRAEEIVPEVQTLSSLAAPGELLTSDRGGRDAAALLAASLGSAPPRTPPAAELAAFWADAPSAPFEAGSPVVEMRGLTLSRGDATLLRGVDWVVRAGESWQVEGGNGAGKSTLTSLLARGQGAAVARRLRDAGWAAADDDDDDAAPPAPAAETQQRLEGTFRLLGRDADGDGGAAGGVAVVSTESHLSLARVTAPLRVVLRCLGASEAAAARVARWLRLDGSDLLDRPYADLSQGEQKLALLGAALAARPRLLVADEVCQGLDAHNRELALGLLELVGAQTPCSLLYVTHHADEALPSVSRFLRLEKGGVV